jgi:hypothetical protein
MKASYWKLAFIAAASSILILVGRASSTQLTFFKSIQRGSSGRSAARGVDIQIEREGRRSRTACDQLPIPESLYSPTAVRGTFEGKLVRAAVRVDDPQGRLLRGEGRIFFHFLLGLV